MFNLTPWRPKWTLLAPWWRLKTGREGAKAFLWGICRTLFGARFRRLQQFSVAASVPTGAVAWPRCGSLGLARVWRGNMCVVVGAVGRMAGAHSGKDAHRNVWAPSGPVSGACVGPSRPTESELYAQNLPYKFKKSYGDLQNRNFEKPYRTTGPWSDLSPDS